MRGNKNYTFKFEIVQNFYLQTLDHKFADVSEFGVAAPGRC